MSTNPSPLLKPSELFYRHQEALSLVLALHQRLHTGDNNELLREAFEASRVELSKILNEACDWFEDRGKYLEGLRLARRELERITRKAASSAFPNRPDVPDNWVQNSEAIRAVDLALSGARR